jgi:hypothetical protein
VTVVIVTYICRLTLNRSCTYVICCAVDHVYVVKIWEKGNAHVLELDMLVLQGLTLFIAGSDTVCCRFSLSCKVMMKNKYWVHGTNPQVWIDVDLLGHMDGTYLRSIDISYDILLEAYDGYHGAFIFHVFGLHIETCSW